VALSDFRGKVVVLAFLDPKCTDVCPLTDNEFRFTAEALGNGAAQLAFLVVNMNPAANSVAQVSVATVGWGVQGLQGWHFLTGSREELEPVYRAYHIEAEGPPKPGRADELQHTSGLYIINQDGDLSWYVSTPLVEEGLVSPWTGPRLGEILEARIRELLALKARQAYTSFLPFHPRRGSNHSHCPGVSGLTTTAAPWVGGLDPPQSLQRPALASPSRSALLRSRNHSLALRSHSAHRRSLASAPVYSTFGW
jgi:hypothetical protein